MSGVYLTKVIAYATLAIFLTMERIGVIFESFDFEYVLSAVLIYVAILEVTVNFYMYCKTMKRDREGSID